MPCRRCSHLRRPCEINARPTTSEKSSSDIVESRKDLMERLRCITFILKYYLPHLALDIDSLRSTCDHLSAPSPAREQNETPSELPGLPENVEQSAITQASGSPGIEDEDCTIDSVDDTTVRTFSFHCISFATSLTSIIIWIQITPVNFLTGTFLCTLNAL